MVFLTHSTVYMQQPMQHGISPTNAYTKLQWMNFNCLHVRQALASLVALPGVLKEALPADGAFARDAWCYNILLSFATLCIYRSRRAAFERTAPCGFSIIQVSL